MTELSNVERHTLKQDKSASMANRLDGKTAIITGAGSGIGRAVVLRFINEGAFVLAIDINENGLKETVTLASHPERISHAVLSVSDEKAVKQNINQFVDEQGHLDILINVAGILYVDSVIDTKLEDFQAVLNTNLIGTFLMCRTCLPHLIRTKGNIVNTASTAALHGHPFMSAYAASKGAIISFTKSLAREYLFQGVRVNAVAPGGIDTPMNKNIHLPLDINHPVYDNIRIPNGKYGKTEDIAGVIAMLASEDGRFINGDVIRIDGGVHS